MSSDKEEDEQIANVVVAQFDKVSPAENTTMQLFIRQRDSVGGGSMDCVEVD